jgi:hypothetical protein
MARATYYARIAKGALWAALGACIVAAALAIESYARSGLGESLASAVGCTALTGLIVLGLRNYDRPVLEISDAAIEHGPIVLPRRRRIRIEDVEGVAASRPSRVLLTTRSGGRVGISLWYIAKQKRGEAREEIERWVAERGNATG